MPEYIRGTYAQRNTGEACWSCAGLQAGAPGTGCIYLASHNRDWRMVREYRAVVPDLSPYLRDLVDGIADR